MSNRVCRTCGELFTPRGAVMSDHRALIDASRRLHQPGENSAWCVHCRNYWPCIPARLADALEQQAAALSAEVEVQCDYVTETTRAAFRLVAERDAAQARADRLATALDLQGGISAGIFRDLVAREVDVVDAQARAERLAGYVRHRPDCEIVRSNAAAVWDGSATCSCGLSAALGLAADKKVESDDEALPSVR